MGPFVPRKRRNDLTLAAEVGARMRDLRLERGLSLADVHDRGGPTSWQMSRIERGKVDFVTDTIFNIAEALGVRPWQLLTNDEDLVFLDKRKAERILFVNPEFVLPKKAEPFKKAQRAKGGKQ